MLQFFSRRLHSERGFTLIELLIVVAIIAILAAILIPNFLRARAQSQLSATKGNMKNSATALESYFVDNNAYPTAITQLTPSYVRVVPNDACLPGQTAFLYAASSNSYTVYASSWAGVPCSATLGYNGVSYTPSGGLVTY